VVGDSWWDNGDGNWTWSCMSPCELLSVEDDDYAMKGDGEGDGKLGTEDGRYLDPESSEDESKGSGSR
jgi:hypothetical protein